MELILCLQMDVVTSGKEKPSVYNRIVLDDREDLALLHQGWLSCKEVFMYNNDDV